MSFPKIVTGPQNPILRQKSKKVEKINSAIKKMVKDMKDILLYEKGVGLAAPQIGKNVRVILICLNHGTPREMVMPMINPELIAVSTETIVMEEGCLSLPGVYGKTARSKEVTVKFITLAGEKQILKLNELNARVIQHEIDHLDGVMFIDKLVAEDQTAENVKKINY